MSFLTLPRTRHRVAEALTRRPVLLRLCCWGGMTVATWPYIFLRGIADNTGMPREQMALAVERTIGFGTPLSERLQGWFFNGSLRPFDWLLLGSHAAWFFVPGIITLYIVVFRWDLFPQLAAIRLGVLYAGLIGFFLLPTEPPWMACPIVRILDVKAGAPLSLDANPLAAFPSLHVALPAALTMWLWARRLRVWALLLALYTALTTLDVIYLGEHYLVDALAGLALAYVVLRLVVRFLPLDARPASAAPPRSAAGAGRWRRRSSVPVLRCPPGDPYASGGGTAGGRRAAPPGRGGR